MKFLLWTAVALALVMWVTRVRERHPKKEPGHARRAQGESMVCCGHCGMHVPVSEAVTAANGQLYCSDEHRRLHAGL